MLTDDQEYMKNQIRDSMLLKETDELLEIWRRADHEEWTDLAFEAVHEILLERLGEIPARELERKAPWVMRPSRKPEHREELAPAPEAIQDFLRQQTYETMDGMETEELIEIWQKADHVQWTDQAFDVVKQILTERIGQVPGQEPEQAGMDEAIPYPGSGSVPVINRARQESAADDSPEGSVLGGLISMKCPDCGEPITEQDRYCPNCGVDLEAPLDENSLNSLGMQQIEKAQETYNQGWNFKSALEECDMALEYIPNSAFAHNLRGLILDALDKTGLAAQEYREALRLDPGLIDARDNLEDAEAELKSWQS